MSPATQAPAATDRYFDLVRAFPLMRIKDDGQLAKAHAVFRGLMESTPDRGVEAYMEVLADLIGAYED